MLSVTLRIALACCIMVYFIILISLLKKQAINMKYSLIWILFGVVMSLLVIFPNLLKYISHFFGIASEMNGLFTFALGFVICILLSLTVIASRQAEKIKRLVQTVAVLEKQIRDMEERNDR